MLTLILNVISIISGGIGVIFGVRSVFAFMKMSNKVKSNAKLLTALLPFLMFSDNYLSDPGFRHRKVFLKHFGVASLFLGVFSVAILLRDYF